MLNSIGVVVVIIGLFYLITWLLKNDDAKTINDQHGLFAMRRIKTDDGLAQPDTKPRQPQRPGSPGSRTRSRRISR